MKMIRWYGMMPISLVVVVIGLFFVRPTDAQVEGIIATAWSPDGQMIAVSGEDGLLQIWDALTGTVTTDITGLSGTVRSVSWSPDSARIASAGDNKIIQIWNAKSGQLLASLAGHNDQIAALDWSSDGSKIASVVVNIDANLSLRTWDAINYQPIGTQQAGNVQVVKWSPNSSQIAVLNIGVGVIVLPASLNVPPLDVINYRMGPNSAEMGWAGAFAWRSDGNAFAVGYEDGKIYLWDVATNQQIRVLDGHTDWVGSLSWSPDTTRLVSTSNDGTLKVWDVNSGTILASYSKGDGLTLATAWNPDSSMIAYGDSAGALHIVPAPTSEHLAAEVTQEGG